MLRIVLSKLGLTGLPSQIYIMLTINLLMSFGRNLAVPYLAMYMAGNPTDGGLGIDGSLIGFVMMISGFGYTLALLATGNLCDKFGRRKMILLFIIPQIFLMASYAYVKTYSEIFFVYVVGGVLGAFYDPAFNAMIADLVSPERREEVYGLSYMIMNIGTVLSPPIGGIIASTSGYPILFIYATIFTAICSIIILLGLKETYSENTSTDISLSQFIEIFKHKTFIVFCFLSMLTSIVYTQLYGLFSVYTEYMGFEPYIFGILFSINGAMVVLLQIPLRKGAMKVGSTKTFIIAQTMYAAGFAFFMLSSDFLHFLIGVAVLTLGEIAFVPAVNGFVANLSPPDKRGRYMALLGLFYGIGGSVGSFFGFGLFDILPDKAVVWGLVGGIGFATLPGYIYLMKASRKTELPTDQTIGE